MATPRSPHTPIRSTPTTVGSTLADLMTPGFLREKISQAAVSHEFRKTQELSPDAQARLAARLTSVPPAPPTQSEFGLLWAWLCDFVARVNDLPLTAKIPTLLFLLNIGYFHRPTAVVLLTTPLFGVITLLLAAAARWAQRHGLQFFHTFWRGLAEIRRTYRYWRQVWAAKKDEVVTVRRLQEVVLDVLFSPLMLCLFIVSVAGLGVVVWVDQNARQMLLVTAAGWGLWVLRKRVDRAESEAVQRKYTEWVREQRRGTMERRETEAAKIKAVQNSKPAGNSRSKKWYEQSPEVWVDQKDFQY
ncbi:hypothetical protein EDC01DRAFT_732784 [Geopyxis carbonaria]|nr:hypothetical protein EDC01DRAFT_732784 [Geopyxis carbonaria]